MGQSKKAFQEYIKDVFPGRSLSIQQMAAVGRWLRKQGFDMKKEYDVTARREIKYIVYDSRKILPNSCPVKIGGAARIIALPTSSKVAETVRLEEPKEDIKAPAAGPPRNFQEAIAYINELHTVIELLVGDLEEERAKNKVEVPRPSEKVAAVLQSMDITHPCDK